MARVLSGERVECKMRGDHGYIHCRSAGLKNTLGEPPRIKDNQTQCQTRRKRPRAPREGGYGILVFQHIPPPLQCSLRKISKWDGRTAYGREGSLKGRPVSASAPCMTREVRSLRPVSNAALTQRPYISSTSCPQRKKQTRKLGVAGYVLLLHVPKNQGESRKVGRRER